MGWPACAWTLVAAQRLPGILRAHDWRVKAAVIGNQVTAVLPPHNPPLGFAVDLGIDQAGRLSGGPGRRARRWPRTGMMNPQIAYGEDVMARLTYVVQQPDGAQQLQKVIVAGLDDLARTLVRAGWAAVRATLSRR